MKVRDYADFISRAQRRHGSQFSSESLNPDFIPYYQSQERIEVSFCDVNGKEYERKRGRIGVTTGWKPCFLLMLRKNSTGSSYTINNNDKVVKVISQ